MARRYGISAVIQGSLAIAALSTLGDFIWATWIPRHRPAYGMTHGTLLFLAIGFVLGVVAHRRAAGAIAGALIGAAGAAGFYLLAPLAGYAAMFLMWIAIWVALGVLAVWLMTGTFDLRDGLTRGAAAAVASGAAFYAISGIWRPFDPRGWDYATHFGAWTLRRGVPYISSPILVGDELYVVNDTGILTCLDAGTGVSRWQQRLGGNYAASPVFADGRIHFQSEEGVTTVIAPGREFRRLASNQLDGGMLASMAVSGGSIFIRTDTHLYRITSPR